MERQIQKPLARHGVEAGTIMENGEIKQFKYKGRVWKVIKISDVSPKRFRDFPVAGVVFTGYERVYKVSSNGEKALAYVYFYRGHEEADLRAILDGFERL